MAEHTEIAWTDSTWSPWEGCTKISPACDNCYAASMNRWLKKGRNWGPGAPRLEYSDEHWEKPIRWNARAAKTGARRFVFPSVCDPFDNEVRDELRARFFGLIAATPNLTWLILTKRIGNVARMLGDYPTVPMLPNIWLGATMANREEMLRDGPKLAATQARVRFWSVEPMLGDLGPIPRELMPDWVIVGGESGRNARPMHPDWPRSLRDQCAAAGVPLLMKQWGEFLPAGQHHEGSEVIVPRTGYAWDDGTTSWRIGKPAAGRLLDGVLHDGFPEVRHG